MDTTAATPLASADKTALNARRAARRRHVTRTLGDVRAQLSSPSGVTPDFDYELLVSHARDRQRALLWLPLVAAAVAWIASNWMPWGMAAVWACAASLAEIATAGLAMRFLRLERKKVLLASWRRYFIVSDMASGLVWSVIFILPSAVGAVPPLYPTAAYIVMIAAIAFPSTNLPPALLGATLPAAIAAVFALVVRWAPDGQMPLDYYLMAALVAGIEAFFVGLGYRLLGATVAEVHARSEKDGLIAELEQANAISDESRRKAEEANLAKSRFLAAMSHELRTPLNAILGFSEVMHTEMLGPIENDTYKGYIVDIHESGRHLLNLINEILDLSRIEAGRQQLSEEAIMLSVVTEDCAHMMSLRARNKGVTILEQYEDNLPKVWADERAIRQVVLNLLSNALKFTPSGGSITLKVGWTAGAGQYVTVKDTGPGIPEEEIPIVLSAFGQGSIAIKSAEQGTGLGLNIVQALVQMHGGTFDLKSKLREGTEATMTLPKTRVLDTLPALDDGKASRARMGMPVASVAMLEAMRRQMRGTG